MADDPREGERRFRQGIERAAAARQLAARSRRPRAWVARVAGWLAAALFWRAWVTPLLAALALLGGVFVLIFGLAVRLTQAYACALSAAERDPAVIARLGAPVEAGFFAWSGGWARRGSVTDGAFSTSLRGPRGEGTLRVRWYDSPVGSSVRIELRTGGETLLVHSGAAPCE